MHGPLSDPFDPTTWTPDTHEFRIWLDDREGMSALVDEIDYHWAIKWRWSPKPSRSRHKFYAYRTVGNRPAKRSLFLHVAIMWRTGICQPVNHIIVDHRNGNSLDCRRDNLRWATLSMNRRNIDGRFPNDLLETLCR